MNDMHKLHETKNEVVLWWLQHELRSLRGSAGDISKAAQAPTRSATACADAAGCAEAGRDSGGNQGTGVTL